MVTRGPGSSASRAPCPPNGSSRASSSTVRNPQISAIYDPSAARTARSSASAIRASLCSITRAEARASAVPRTSAGV
jgi:hypothetical protein